MTGRGRLHRQKPQFQIEPLRGSVPAWFTTRSDHAMAGNDDWEAVARHDRSHRSSGSGETRLFRQATVTDRLPIGNSSSDFNDARLKIGCGGHGQRHVGKVDRLAQTVSLEPQPQVGVPIFLTNFHATSRLLRLPAQCATNIVGRSMSSQNRDKMRFFSQQTEPAEIRRKNRQTWNRRRGRTASNPPTCTLTHVHHPFTMDI